MLRGEEECRLCYIVNVITVIIISDLNHCSTIQCPIATIIMIIIRIIIDLDGHDDDCSRKSTNQC